MDYQSFIGKWYDPRDYSLDEMIEEMKSEGIENQQLTRDESKRFLWRGSLVMVKTTGKVQINSLNPEKEVFIEKYRKNHLIQQKLF